MSTGSNVDPVRREIVRLENSVVFDAPAWERVLDALESQGRSAGFADALRRRECARMRQASVFEGVGEPVVEVA